MDAVYFCGYDDKGDLFVDGRGSDGFQFRFAELPKGKETFVNILLKGARSSSRATLFGTASTWRWAISNTSV